MTFNMHKIYFLVHDLLFGYLAESNLYLRYEVLLSHSILLKKRDLD